MVDFKWGTLYGRLYLVDFTWTTIAGPAIVWDYVRLNCYLNYKISHRSHFSTFSTFYLYDSWSSASFTASMEPIDAPTTAPSMVAPEVNRPVVPSRKRLPFSRSQSNGTLPGTTPSPTSWRQAKTKASFPGLVSLQNESFRSERPIRRKTYKRNN